MAQAMMNATTTSEDGFISYAREDRDLVDRLHAALLERGKKTWVDWEGIAPSAEWLRTIFEAIDRAQVFIVVISPDLLQSRTCMMEEVRHALEVGKKIIPIVGRDFVDDDVPEAHAGSMEGLRKLNYVFLRQGDDFPRGVDELVRALETDHEHVRWHTEYLRSARMWQQAGERRALLLRGDVLEDAETWLTTIGDKKPPASELQLEFIRASRTASRKRRRQLTGVLILGFVLMSALAGVALWQGSVAEKAQQVSERERDQARHQEGLAWLERANNALKDKVFFDARMYAGRALGFPGYEPEPGGDSFPPLLRAESEYATNAASLIRGSPGFDQLWQTPVARHHRSKIKAMARSKSGDIIASVAMDGFLRIWDRGAPREHINAHAGFLTAVAVSPDGRWVVAGGYESTVVVYDVAANWDVRDY
jgi:hypothetical protein